MNILVIEDDAVIRRSVERGLSEIGHDVCAIGDGARGLQQALAHTPDLLILDLLLPETSGMDILRTLREKGVRCPVIVLTALGSVDERVAGLEAGADDYLVKPFAFAELLARVEAVSRRSMSRPASVLSVGEITLDLATHRGHYGGRDIDLTPTEFSILELLLRYAGQVVSRKMLCEHVWGFTWEGNTNVIEVHVNRLRRKLDQGREESLINTVRGRGYAVWTA